MTVVLTMAGLGSRFKTAGYAEEKYAIPFRGRTLLEWSLLSLRNFADARWIVVTRAYDGIKAELPRAAAVVGLPAPEVVVLHEVTGGQAETVLRAAPLLTEDEPILVWNCDTYVAPDALRPADVRGDGWIPTFRAPGDKWSFVRADADDRALEVTEKVRISDDCSIGLYGFASFGLFLDAYARRDLSAHESYVAPLYAALITDGRDVRLHRLPDDTVVVLGTPEDLAEADRSARP